MTPPTRLAPLNEGDVYSWHYTDAVVTRRKDHIASGTLYWCEDRQAVVRNGQLCDTYWAGYGLTRGSEEHVKNPAEVELTFVCNLADVRRIAPHEVKNYDAADVLDLSYQHGCYKHFVVKVGAQPSREAKLEWIRTKRGEIKRDIEGHIRHLESLARQEAALEAGNVEVSIG